MKYIIIENDADERKVLAEGEDMGELQESFVQHIEEFESDQEDTEEAMFTVYEARPELVISIDRQVRVNIDKRGKKR